jgi:environmental stress-induced protein Ves
MTEQPSSIVRSADVAPQPWANGGGTTRELLRAGDGAWRISLADVDADGPFSSFPGKHRLLTVVDGPVLALVVDGVEQVVEPRRPFAFDGDAEVVASVPEGPVRVLNVIADPAVDAFVTVLELGRTSSLPLADDQAALVLQGRASAHRGEASAYDLVVGPADVTGRCTLAVVTLQRG